MRDRPDNSSREIIIHDNRENWIAHVTIGKGFATFNKIKNYAQYSKIKLNLIY